MATPIVIVTKNGLPVTLASNGRGAPMTVATNGYGLPVQVVASGGMPVTGFTVGPDITAPIITSSNTISQPENAALSHTLTANETVTWAKVGGADTAKFTLTGNTLTLPAKDYEAPDDADANRTYIVQVQATDAAANPSAIQTITVTITDVSEAVSYQGPGDFQAYLMWGSVARGYSTAVSATGTQKAFRVVDGAGANALDILVKTDGRTDVAALNAWIASFGTAHVSVLYDQVGSNDWIQVVNSRMPTITVNAINSLPSLTFSAASTQFLKAFGTITLAQPYSFEAVAQRNSGTAAQEIISTSSPESDLAFDGSANKVQLYAGDGPLIGNAADAVPHVLQGTFNGSSSTINVDGATQVVGQAGASAITSSPVNLGRFDSDVLFLNGYISEAGIYAGAYNSGVQGNARTFYTTSVVTGSGKSVVGLGAGDVSPQTFINVLKAWNVSPSGGATPANLDANGYPSSPFTGSYGGQIVCIFGVTDLLSSGPWVFSWPATRAVFKLEFLVSATVGSTTGSPTITNGAGSGNFTIANTSGAGSVTFNFTSDTTTPTLTAKGDTGTIAYAAGSGDWTLMRVSDVSKYAAGQIFTDEYLAALTTLNPGKIRTMGWVNNTGGNGCPHTKWKYRTTLTSLSWTTPFMHPDVWAGSITGTDFYSCSRPLDMASGAWVAHDTFYGKTANASSTPITVSAASNNGGLIRLTVSSTAALSTNQRIWVFANSSGSNVINGEYLITVINGTTIDLQGSTFVSNYSFGGGTVLGVQTITVSGKTGTKFLANNCGFPIGSSFDSFGADTYQFYYDATMDKVVLTGVGAVIPVEVHAKLANAVNCHLWTTMPHWGDDDYATQWATTIKNYLNTHLNWYTEYSSEMWNTAFSNGLWAGTKGAFLGLDWRSFYALRYRQVMGLFTTVWAGSASRLKRCLNQISLPSQILSNKSLIWDGTTLGSYGYNAKPNRPIDYCDVLVYAPYVSGANLCNTPDGGRPFLAKNAPALQNISTLWNAGNTAGAIAAVDDDIRQGRNLVQTVTASGTTFTTAADHGLSTTFEVAFQVTGGTTYSGLSTGKLYSVSSVPTTKTFTLQAFDATGLASGSNINAGSAGTGTTTMGYTNNMTTIFVAANGVHRAWENAASLYDADRAPHTPSPLVHHWYEGALELVGPTPGEATALGLTGTNPSAAIAAAILAWKNAATSAATIQHYYNSYKGLDSSLSNFGVMSHAGDAANLIVYGGGLYGLISGYETSDPVYQLYNGVVAYNQA